MKRWRTLFMSRLVHIYKTEYLPYGLGTVPAIVTQESNKYQESFDSVAKFMNARIREISVAVMKQTLKISSVYIRTGMSLLVAALVANYPKLNSTSA
jgi:hypothetical protein